MWIAFVGLLFTVTMALLAGAFFMGRLSQRVEGLESNIRSEAGTHDAVVILGTQMTDVKTQLAALQRAAEGVQRQLGNLMGLKGGIQHLEEAQR